MATKARILLEQLNVSKNIERLTIVNLEYTINKCNAIDINKLTQSLTKAVYRRQQAEKNGLKLGFKASKPLVLSVTMDDKYIIQTEKLTATTGTAAKIKINSSLLAKDESKEKQRFQDVLKFIIEESEVLHKEFKSAFYNPEKEQE